MESTELFRPWDRASPPSTSCSDASAADYLCRLHRPPAGFGAAPLAPPRACPEGKGGLRARGEPLPGHCRPARRVVGLNARGGLGVGDGAFDPVAILARPDCRWA